jgi:hypothetical protein
VMNILPVLGAVCRCRIADNVGHARISIRGHLVEAMVQRSRS